jgi:glycosyltransferase involved in cell wall biosynthesis
LHGIPEYVVFHNRKRGSRLWYKNWLVLSAGHGQEMTEVARRHGLKRSIRRIRNGPLASAPQPQSRYRDGAGTTIGSLSSFTANKTMGALVRAFALLVERGANVRLVLAGDGSEKAACQSLARELQVYERIEWMGWQSDTERFFSKIDLFCSPSRNEAFGLVILEAMQAGLPVIATATFGARDIVVPGETGWLVPLGDIPALADALMEAVGDRELAVRFGVAGRARFASEYDTKAVGTALAKALGLEPVAGDHDARKSPIDEVAVPSSH